jgi:hypothetical protein
MFQQTTPQWGAGWWHIKDFVLHQFYCEALPLSPWTVQRVVLCYQLLAWLGSLALACLIVHPLLCFKLQLFPADKLMYYAFYAS